MLQVRKDDSVWEQGISEHFVPATKIHSLQPLDAQSFSETETASPHSRLALCSLPSEAGSYQCPAKAQNLAHAKGAQWVTDEQAVLGKKLDLPKRPCAHRNTLLLPMASSLKLDLPFPLELKLATWGQAIYHVKWTCPSSYSRVLVRTD